MIFDSTDQSTNHDRGMVVLTQINDNNGKPVIIALNIEKTSAFHKINDITSIYGKDNVNQIAEWIDDGFLRYSHRNRALAFARFHRLSLPKKATISERSNHTIIDESPNINPISSKNPENSSGGVQFSMSGDLDLGDTSLSPEDYRRSIDPLFDFVMEYTDGIVNPGPEHIGEDFDGSYISEAYNKFSTKRKQGKKESVI